VFFDTIRWKMLNGALLVRHQNDDVWALERSVHLNAIKVSRQYYSKIVADLSKHKFLLHLSDANRIKKVCNSIDSPHYWGISLSNFKLALTALRQEFTQYIMSEDDDTKQGL
jgi:hypothetical protein